MQVDDLSMVIFGRIDDSFVVAFGKCLTLPVVSHIRLTGLLRLGPAMIPNTLYGPRALAGKGPEQQHNSMYKMLLNGNTKTSKKQAQDSFTFQNREG
jgi:hypothetical protein